MNPTYKLIQQRHISGTFANRGLTLVRGKGVYLYDEDGNKYLDFMSNYGVNILGHSLPEVINPLKKQLDNLINLHGSFNNDTRSIATKLLIQKLAQNNLGNLTRIYWCSSGAESIEAALKFAYLHTKRKKFLAVTNSYHGKTLAALSATSSGTDKYRDPLKELLLDFDYVEFGNKNALEKIISDKYAALVIEPVQGEGGINLASNEYFQFVSKLCKKYGVLLVIDEIQTGMGRTGDYFAISDSITAKQRNNFCDILCLGKGLASGIPVGATIFTESINNSLIKGIHTSTFSGNPLAMAGVISTINYIDNQEILRNASNRGELLFRELSKLQQQFSETIKNVRGRGLMIGVELTINVQPVLKSLQEEGLLAISAGDNVLRLLPPLTIESKHIKSAIKIITNVLKNV